MKQDADNMMPQMTVISKSNKVFSAKRHSNLQKHSRIRSTNVCCHIPSQGSLLILNKIGVEVFEFEFCLSKNVFTLNVSTTLLLLFRTT